VFADDTVIPIYVLMFGATEKYVNKPEIKK
jgi:hypothetical protein